MDNVIVIFITVLLTINCSALPITYDYEATENHHVEYLKEFGWFEEGTDDIDDDVDLSLKIEEFQEFAGLEVTGTFDEPTIEKMHAPRCGVPDEVTDRRRRDTFQGSMWEQTSLTYYIGNLTTDLEFSQIKEGIEYAVRLWSDNSALMFTEVDRRADADIKFDFVMKRHGDERDFDGPGKVLAHAFFPNEEKRGQTHFDEDETWLALTEQNDPIGTKYNVMIVAAHEIGHVLGLKHTSANTDSLMKPWPVGYHDNFHLPSDDVTAIQTLYGKPGNMLNVDLCSRGTKVQFDAVLQGPQQRTLFFSDIYYWEIISTGIKQGHPKFLFDLFPSHMAEQLAGMDAIVMSSKTHKIYVFKGDVFWRFDSNFELDANYPKLIIETRLPDHVDAAFEKDGQIYIVRKKKVFLFDEEEQKSSQVRKLKNVFTGVPKGLNAALTWTNGHSYFFKKDKYYKFDEDLGKVVDGYPKPIRGYWFCL
ncbi:matrix metalloproteinase-15-like [Anneissia japonica]|uniref:matrix metalloproteinase-15-like n=1 Tax=Anneissia japonica TaxID=1529436 RepID=UPI0014257331|nr:matrix metalloproteinase-15-like [Anneissia japonica]